MCGINGFTFSDKGLIQAMNETIAHRGPDQQGTYIDKALTLGHLRLSIIDLSEAGRNPMPNRDESIWIIFNGEIYNFQEIREELLSKGYSFRSKTDTEVVLYAYQEWGEGCVKKFNGMWAFALYDLRRQKLFLSRDRLGKKPLYYHFDGKNLFFSSEIKALLKAGIDKTLDGDAVNAFVRLTYIPQPLTIFEKIRKLPPASNLTFDLQKRTLHIEKFWSIEPQADLNLSEKEWIEKIRELFFDSVKRRLIADRPIGFFLSGGIDSTSVLAAAHHLKGKGLKTFSVRFETKSELEKYNKDAELARISSAFYGTEHTEYSIGTKEVLENIEKVIYHMDEPISNATFLATYLLSQEAKKKVDVILGGDGGDELFGGYPKYRTSVLLGHYARIPRSLRVHLFSPLLEKMLRGCFDLSRGLDPQSGVDWYLYFQSEPESVISPLFLKEKNHPEVVRDLFQRLYFQRKYTLKEMHKKVMLTDMQTWLNDEEMMRTDKMTMAWSLEQRCPLLDYRLVELSTQIPTHLKIKGKELKWIFKQAMEKDLPPEVVEASQKKRGFLSPTSKWIREELKPLAQDMLSEAALKKTGFFDPHVVQAMLEGHLRGAKAGEPIILGKNYSATILWSLMVFQLWHRKFLENPI